MENETLQIIDERELFDKEFRIYGTPEKPLFLAKDVAEWIEYSFSNKKKGIRKVSQMLNTVDEEEKVLGVTNIVTQNQQGGLRENTERWFLTEDGLYEVLMQSRKPIAKKFKKEVKEILKSIRKYGAYMTSQKIEEVLLNPDTIIQLATQLKEEQEARRLAELEKEKAHKVIELQSEKVGFYEEFMSVEKLFTVKQVADSFAIKGLGRNNFYQWLRNKEIFSDYSNNKYSCYRNFIELGYFVTRTRTKVSNGQEEPFSLFTVKGVEWIYKKLKQNGFIVNKNVEEIIEDLLQNE